MSAPSSIGRVSIGGTPAGRPDRDEDFQWSQVAARPALMSRLESAEGALAAAVAIGDEVLLFGGATDSQAAAGSAVAWRDGTAPRALAAMPAGRAFHTATRMGDGRVLILGGDTADGDPVKTTLIYE